MQQHVKILAILNIVLGALGVLVAIGVLIFFGGMAGLVHMDNDPDAAVGSAIMGMVGTIAFFFIVLFSVPGLIGGIGLLQFRSWSRILVVIMSVLNLVSFPFGTALGVYGLWVLLQDETRVLFQNKNASVPLASRQ